MSACRIAYMHTRDAVIKQDSFIIYRKQIITIIRLFYSFSYTILLLKNEHFPISFFFLFFFVCKLLRPYQYKINQIHVSIKINYKKEESLHQVADLYHSGIILAYQILGYLRIEMIEGSLANALYGTIA